MFDSKDDRHTLRGGSAKRRHNEERQDGVRKTALARRRETSRSTQEAILDALRSAPIPAPVEPLRKGKTEWDRFDRMYEAPLMERVRAANITYATPERKRRMAVKALIKAHGGPKPLVRPAPLLRQMPKQVIIEHAIVDAMPASGGALPMVNATGTARSGRFSKPRITAGARVHELAKECGTTVEAVVSHLTRMGEYVKDGRSTVAAPIARMVREDLGAYIYEVALVACGCKVYESTSGDRKVIHSKMYGCTEAYIKDPIVDPDELARVYGGDRRVEAQFERAAQDRAKRVSSDGALALLRERLSPHWTNGEVASN